MHVPKENDKKALNQKIIIVVWSERKKDGLSLVFFPISRLNGSDLCAINQWHTTYSKPKEEKCAKNIICSPNT